MRESSKSTMRKVAVFALVVSSALLIAGCASSPEKSGSAAMKGSSAPTAAKVYTRYNIHTAVNSGGLRVASFANFTDPGPGHKIVPLNSEIIIGRWKRGFSFRTKNDPEEILFEVRENMTNMPANEYLGLITSPQPVSLGQISELDRKGISDGKAYKGMTKKGVMAAMGYPAAHMTPSLDSNQYTYWRNRFSRRIVSFDAQGKVSTIDPAYN